MLTLSLKRKFVNLFLSGLTFGIRKGLPLKLMQSFFFRINIFFSNNFRNQTVYRVIVGIENLLK